MELVVSFPLEAVGLFAFGMSGVLVALEKRMDLIGVCVLAITTACGGGMLRDVLLNQPLPAFFTHRSYLCIVASAIVVTLLGNAALRRHHQLRRFDLSLPLDIADAVGLATFGTSAALIVVDMPGNLITCVFISCLTACGGGMLRDVFAQRIPMIFSGPLYATPCILGPWCCITACAFCRAPLRCCFALVLGLRLLAIFFHIGMPRFLYYDNNETNAPDPAQ